MNWKSQVGKLISDGKTTHTCFYQEKGMEDDEGKNKSTTPSLTFPFSLNINKAGNLAQKEDMHQGGYGIKQNY